MPVAETSSDPYIGRTFGNVRLVKKIGQGGMGMVYRGRHERFGRDVAVKLLPPHHDEKKLQYQKRFLREGRTAAAIHHRNVVQVMDAGSENGVAYLVLEFVDGSSIGDLLDECTKIDPAEVERLAVEMAEGLHAIHMCNVVHRDIKPDNILLTQQGQIKITDLGLARQLNDPEVNRLTATGMVVGTPLYVSPEAIRDTKSSGPKADVYSLGGTLYHMLSGKPPFLGNTPYDVMRAHLDQRPEPLRQIDPSIPKHLANLVHLCLSKDPDERPSPQEVSRILREQHMVRDGGSRTTVMLMIAAAVAVISLAVLAWQFVSGGQSAATQLAVVGETTIRIDATPSRDAEFKINDGSWKPLTSDVITVEPGLQTLYVQKSDLGTRMRSSNEINAIAGEETPIQVTFNPIETARELYRFEDSGDGIVYVMGEIRGSDPSVTFDQVGTYETTRFDGAHFLTTTVSVSEITGLTASQVNRSTRPPEQAFFLSSHQGQSTPTHHLCCWQIVEWARLESALASDSNWSRGAARPYEAAIHLSDWLAQAAEAWASPFGMQLPDEATAAKLNSVYSGGPAFWYRDSQSNTLKTWPADRAANALLALIPSNR